MAILDLLKDGLVQLRAAAESGQQHCLTAASSLLTQGSERLGELSRSSGVLSPQLRRSVEGRILNLQHRFDVFNRVLAEVALPRDRREQVKRLSSASKPRTISRRRKSAKKNI